MSYFLIDVETDGPIPGDYSLLSLGAIVVEPSLSQTFYGEIQPISDQWNPEALKVSGFTREQTLTFADPKVTIARLADWIQASSQGKPFFISDNNGFDWQFVNWYFHHFLGSNPFGHTSTNLGSLYS